MKSAQQLRYLENARRAAAEQAVEEFDFAGHDAQVEDRDGWCSSTADDAWTCAIYLADEHGGDSTRVTFVVRFKPDSADVAEAYVSGW